MLIWGLLPANFIYLFKSVRLIFKQFAIQFKQAVLKCLTLISLKNISSFSPVIFKLVALYFELYQFTFTLQNALV